jgi:hypothetical protein
VKLSIAVELGQDEAQESFEKQQVSPSVQKMDKVDPSKNNMIV